MSSSTVYHPGLTFATLVLQFVMANGGMISRPEPRHRGSGEESDPDESTAQPSATPSSNSSMASSTSGSAKTSSTNISTQNSSNPSSTSASTSASPSTTTTSTSSLAAGNPTAPPTISAVGSNISTPVVVGSVIGSVVAGGLLVLLLIFCCRRIRGPRKDPDTASSVRFFSRSPKAQVARSDPEMSQMHSSPLIASAIASGLTSNPFATPYAHSLHSSNSSPASSSPLVPASNLPRHSNSVTSSSGRSTSHTTATSELEILQPPRGSPLTSSPSTLLPIIAAAAEAVSISSAPTSVELSPLHRSLTMHQKALETDEKGREGNMEFEEIQGVNDPPPEYQD